MKKVFIFQDSRGNFYFGEFKDRDAAMRHAYKCGLCFIGSTFIPEKAEN